MGNEAIAVAAVSKTYGQTHAVSDISLRVGAGEILAVVGPNGAGKTTLIEMIEGLRRPDTGTIRVLSLEPWANRRRLAQHIGVQLQHGGLHPRLKVAEAIALHASLYRKAAAVDDVLGFCGLEQMAGKHVGILSGGQQKRVALALALVNEPDILFLDELTTGLDPDARRDMWDLLSQLQSKGTTVLFVTHYMEEASSLGDRVLIMDGGRIRALDAPQAITEEICPGYRVVFDAWTGPLPPVESPVYRAESRQGRLYLYTTEPDTIASAYTRRTSDAPRVERTDFEDAYLALIGGGGK